MEININPSLLQIHIHKKEDDITRLELLGIKSPGDYDCCHFEGLTYETYEKLLSLGFVNPDEAQNDAPTFGEMAEFCKEHKAFTMHGYVITPERTDCCITCEGVESKIMATREDIIDFVDMFRYADEFTISDEGCYAWFD